jgi:AbrB family looped-hinge helix DNA binding protein
MGGFAVTLVKVKEKYQVTLPASVRQKAKVAVGDLLEATVEGKKITLTPKSIVDREIALALEDVKKGRVYGPFSTAKETIRSLHREANKLRKK